MATVTKNPFHLTATKGGGNFDLAPAGNHMAVLFGIIDLGTRFKDFKGKGDNRDIHEVAILWELTAEFRPDGHPIVVAKSYELSFGEKSRLRQMVEGWRGKTYGVGDDFDLTSLMDKPCMVNIVHKATASGKNAAEVEGVKAVPKGMTVSPRTRDPILYIAEEGAEPPAEDWLPFLFGQSIPDIIKSSKEYQGLPTGTDEAPEPAAPATNGQANGHAADPEDSPF